MAENLTFTISAVDQSKAAVDSARKNIITMGTAAKEAATTVMRSNRSAGESIRALASETRTSTQAQRTAILSTASTYQQAARQIVDANAKARDSIRRVADETRSSRTSFNQFSGVVRQLALAKVAKEAFDASVKFGSLERSLVTITGSGAAAAAQLARLSELAKLPGIGFEEAIQGSVRLQAAGLSAREAEQAIQGFAIGVSRAGGGKDDLKEVVVNLQQIASAGRLTGDELKETAQRVPELRKVLKARFGTDSTEELSKMNIDTKRVISEISAEFIKMGGAVDSPRNAFDNLDQAGQKALRSIGDAIAKPAEDLARKLTPAIEQAGEAFKKLPPALQQLIVGGALVGGVAGNMGGGILEAAANIALLKNLRGGKGGLVAGAADDAAIVATQAAKRGGVRGLLGGAGRMLGRVAGPLGVVYTAAELANGLGNFSERGQEKVGLFDAFVGGVRSLIPGADEAATDTAGFRAREAMRARFAKEGTPRQQILRQQAAERQEQAAALKRDDDRKAAVVAGGEDGRLSAEQARAEALSGGDPAEEAKRVIPILLKRRDRALSEMKKLEPQLNVDAKATADYWKLAEQAWAFEGQARSAQKQAHDAVVTAQKQAAQKQKELHEQMERARKEQLATLKAARAAQIEAVEAQVENLPEASQADGRLQKLAPLLQRQQAEARAELAKLQPNTREFFEKETEIARREKELADIRNDALKSRGEAMKAAAEAAKKAMTDQREALFGAADLAREQLQTLESISPQLADRFKKERLLPALRSKLAGLSQATPGEDASEAARRQLEAERTRQEILGASGFDREGMKFGRTLGGGTIPLFDQRGALDLYQQLSTGGGASGSGGPLINNAVFNFQGQTVNERRREWLQFFEETIAPTIGGLPGI